MKECELINIPNPIGANLSIDWIPKTKEEVEDMSRVSYDSVIGSLKYVMVCISLDIAHAMGFSRKYMSTMERTLYSY